MRFPDPLIPGRLRSRYKRFFADVILDDGTPITAHCPNPGAMLGLKQPGLPAWVSPARDPKRKLRYTLELVEVDGHLVGINTGHPNRIVAEALEEGRIPELAGFDRLRREVRYGENSRVDILLESGNRPPTYVEVKNVHLERGGAAAFPDSVTARGTKHLRELSGMVAQGARAVMFYLVQRGDCDHFTTAPDIDPDYDAALREAVRTGVETVCYACRVTRGGIVLERAMPIRL